MASESGEWLSIWAMFFLLDSAFVSGLYFIIWTLL